MKAEVDRKRQRHKRHMRARRRLIGTDERPRLAVFCSLKHVSAQIINDWEAHTLVAAGTVEEAIAGECAGSAGDIAAAAVVGRAIAERALAQGIDTVCFDCGGRTYHGRVQALAEAAREAGLQF